MSAIPEDKIPDESKPKIIYNKETNKAYEFFELAIARNVRRDFWKKGTVKKQFTEKGNFGILISSKNKIIGTVTSTMKIGDQYEGKRVMDLKFDKFHITNIEKKEGFMVGFVYTLD